MGTGLCALLVSLAAWANAESSTQSPLLSLLQSDDCVCGANFTLSPYHWAELHSNAYKFARGSVGGGVRMGTGEGGGWCVEDCEWRIRSSDGGRVSLLFARIDTVKAEPIILWDGEPRRTSRILAVCTSLERCGGVYNSSGSVLGVTWSSGDGRLDVAGARPAGFSASVALRPWRLAYEVLRVELATKPPHVHRPELGSVVAVSLAVLGGFVSLGAVLLAAASLRRCLEEEPRAQDDLPPPSPGPLPPPHLLCPSALAFRHPPSLPPYLPAQTSSLVPPPEYQDAAKDLCAPPAYDTLSLSQPSSPPPYRQH